MSAILSRTTGLLGGLGVTVQPWMTLVTLAVTMGENRLIKKMSTRAAVLDALNGTNEKLDEIKSMLSDIAAMTKSSFELVVDIRFKEGVEKIAAAYTVFLDVSSSQEAWETHMQQFESHVWEYKKDYALYMDPKRLEEYLNTLAGQNGFTKMSNALEFILTTEAQYLHLMVHFHSYKEDQEAVTRQFESFNEHVEFLNEVAAKEVMRIIPKHTVGSIFKGVRVEMTNCPLFFKFIVDEYVAGVEAACRCLSPAKLNTGTEGSKMTIALPYKEPRPLILAAEMMHSRGSPAGEKILKTLLQAGADPNLPLAKGGQSTYKFIKRYCRTEDGMKMLRIFEAFGGKD